MKINSFSPVNHKVAVRHPCYSFVALAIATCFLLASANCIFANSERKNRKAMADSATPTEPTCSVENFGKVNDHYYRGAQPEAGQYEQLKALGIKTVIDLRDDPTDFAKGKAEAAGLRYLNMPLSDKKAPAEENVNKFLEYANDENNWPIFVHCAGGRHRTGAMTAVYRMTVDGWQIERAYEEMKDYDFYTRWGHKAMKTFVFDYAKDLQARKAHLAVADGTVATPNVVAPQTTVK